jgi:hypothetical protein
MRNVMGLVVAAGVTAILTTGAQGAISYGTAGATYTEGFNALPVNDGVDPDVITNNAAIQPAPFVNGWIDDRAGMNTAGNDNNVSVPGWYLYHPLDPSGTEDGVNDHQRFRFGSGSQNTGSYWGYSTNGATDGERALGSLGSVTVADNNVAQYVAVRLNNNTGVTLTQFTLTYDGEQWRDGSSTSTSVTGNTAEKLSFGYSSTATGANWFLDTTPFNAVPALDFTAPVVNADTTATSGATVNGNVEGRVNNITATVTGVNWAPGADLWLRWADLQLANEDDDGLAVDDVEFTAAVPEPAGLAVLAWGGIGLVARRRCRMA